MARRLAPLAALVGLALAAGPASAAPVSLGGSPLNVQVDELGQLQALRTDREVDSGIFFPAGSTTGDAGLFLARLDDPEVFGFPVTSGPTLTPYTNTSQGPVTGSGTAADPLTQITKYNAGPAPFIQITQTTTYVNGAQQFMVRWDVRNPSAGALHVKAIAAADFFFDGSDRGTGIFTLGPPRFVGGTNADTGNSGGFEEVLTAGFPAWSHYQALEFGPDSNQVWGKVEASAGSASPSLDDTVVGEQVDNAGAVEWDGFATDAGIPGGQTRSFALIVRSAVPAALQLSPTNAGSPRGVPVNITATATDTSGTPYSGRTLRYNIVGVNATAGAVTLGPSGQAVITDPGTNAGDDTVVAFVDFNNNGTRETAEPQASALVTFVDKVAPSCSVKVTGDRPGGGGGAGKPLVITVNCNEGATVSVATSLRPVRGRSSSSARARAIKLRKVTRVLTPGKRFAFKLKLPRKVARKYAGKKLKATFTVTAKDASGNVKRKKTRRTIKVRPLRRRR